MNKKGIKILVAILFTFILLFFLLKQVKLSDIKAVFSNISPGFIVPAFLFYFLCYVIRTIRFNLLFTNKIKGMFSIISINTMLNNLLPMRLGELSFFYFVQKTKKSSLGESAGAFFIARTTDLLSIGIIFILGVSILKNVPDVFKNIILTISIFVLAVVAILILAILKGVFIVNLTKKLFKITRLGKIKIFQKIIAELDMIPLSFENLKKSNRLYIIFITTFLAWSANYLFIYFMVLSMQIEIPLGVIILTGTFVVLTSVLPINTIGSIGVIEGVWAATLIAFGIPKELAIASGFGYHVFLLLFSLFLGGIGYFNLSRILKKQNQAKENEF